MHVNESGAGVAETRAVLATVNKQNKKKPTWPKSRRESLQIADRADASRARTLHYSSHESLFRREC